jgi:uncharacterized damage-inducible protein DinB
MVYGGKELAEAFRTVRKNTLQIAEDIPEDKYSYRVTPETMSVAEDLAHLASFTSWPPAVHGQDRKSHFVFEDFMPHIQRTMELQNSLKTKAEIVEALKREGDSFAAFLEGISDETLSEIVTFPPDSGQASKSRLEMLMSVKEHEMHHRAKLMVVQRLIGQVPHLTKRRQEIMAARAAGTAAAAR